MSMNPWIRRALWVTPVLLVAAVLAWRSLRPMPVDVLTVQPQTLVRTLQFSGRVAALARVDVGSTLTGRVADVRVQEGDTVKRGEVLIRLETDELQAAVAQAQAAERQAEATLVSARATLARARQLVNQNFYSAAQLDEAQRAVDVAQAQQQAAQATTAAARARLAQAVIVAPRDARVLARNVEPGQIVQPGKALLGMALAGPTQLDALVDERFLDQLRVGQQARVVADAFGGQPFAAQVATIAPQIDAQRGAVEVKFSLAGSPPAFVREDMTLSIEVQTGRRDNTLALPMDALRDAVTETATVLRVQDGRLQSQTVRLGLRTLDAVEVTGGLAAGDAVVRKPEAWAEGRRVQAKAVAWTPAAATANRQDDVATNLTQSVSQSMGR